MAAEGAVSVCGRDAFRDTDLTCSGDLSYIGGNWQRDIAFAGISIPLAGDFPAEKMLSGLQVLRQPCGFVIVRRCDVDNALPQCEPSRRDQIIEALDLDPSWRMHKVSDGQRRRVQLAFGLMRPFRVLLLDEITVDLDVLARAELLAFLAQETIDRQATIIYATHIFGADLPLFSVDPEYAYESLLS